MQLPLTAYQQKKIKPVMDHTDRSSNPHLFQVFPLGYDNQVKVMLLTNKYSYTLLSLMHQSAITICEKQISR